MTMNPDPNERGSFRMEQGNPTGRQQDIHFEIISRIQQHVEARNAPRLIEFREFTGNGSKLQKTAMDRISVLLAEIISSSRSIMEGFRNNPSRSSVDDIIGRIDAGVENTTRLADRIAHLTLLGKADDRKG